MNRHTLSIVLFASILPPTFGQQCGDSFVTTFTGFVNDGGWVWTGIVQAGISEGGNPGYLVRSMPVQTDRPSFSSTQISPFSGDYRAALVTSVGIDLRTARVDASACARPLALVLETDNSTPSIPTDDAWVYFVTDHDVPCTGAGWHSYLVDVPSTSSTLPAGWLPDPGGSLGGDAAWNLVISNVTYVRWIFGDPTASYATHEWITEADNARIAWLRGPSSYCPAKINSKGCSAAIGWTGIPSATLVAPFFVRATQVINQKPGLLLYGDAPAEIPFQGGFLCVSAHLRRSTLLDSGGHPPPDDCSGFLWLDFNAWIRSGVDPLLVPGKTVYAQFWSRDPSSPSGTSLSNALRFTICP